MMRLKYILFAWLLVVTACSTAEKKAPPANTGQEKERIVAAMTQNNQLIAATTIPDSLIHLYRQQTRLAQAAGDVYALCESRLALYDLLRDSLPSVAQLDTVIAFEHILRQQPAGRTLLAKAYGNRYYEYEQQELNHRVVADCEKYLQYTNPSVDSLYLSYVLRAAGIAWSKVGDQQQSVLYLKRLLQWSSACEDAESTAGAAINLANSHLNNNQPSSAIETARAGLRLPGVSVQRRSYLNAVLAQVYFQQNRLPEAAGFIRTAIDLLRVAEADAETLQRLSVLQKVHADVLAGQGQTQWALQACQYSLALLWQSGDSLGGRDAGKTCIALSRLYRRLHQSDSALVYCNRALTFVCGRVQGEGVSLVPLPEVLYPENTIMEALDEKATVLQSLAPANDTVLLGRSLQCLNMAFEVERQLRQHYIFDNSKYSQTEESRRRSENAIRTCMQLHAQTRAQQWLQQAFLFAEKSKSNILLDQVRENLLAGSGNDTAFAKAKELQLMMGRIDDQLRDATGDSAALMAEKERLSRAFSQNKSSINEKLNRVFASGTTFQYDMDSYARALKKKAGGIVSYFMGDSVLYGFAFNTLSGEVMATTTPAAVVTQWARALRPFLTDANSYNNNPARYAALCEQFYEKALQPLLRAVKDAATVIVIPDGELAGIPLGALRVADGGAPAFLVNRFNFMYAFSCTSLLQQMELKPGDPEHELAFFAPFMEKGLRSLPGLPQSEQELAAVRKYQPESYTAVNRQATARAFGDVSGKAAVLHIASHAYASTSDSVLPMLEMADSSVSLNSIYGLNLNNQLVILSACHTGVGNLQKSEGALSLARGFYYAGARNVINSLWEANDESAGKLFQQFYQSMAAEKNIGKALHQSQLQYLKNAGAEKQAPYYWASFVCIGDGGFLEAGGGGLLPHKWILFSLSALAVLAGVLLWKQKTGLRNTRPVE